MQEELLDLLAQALGLMPKKENIEYPTELYEEAAKQAVLPLVLSVAPDDRYKQKGMLIMRSALLVNAAHGDLSKVLSCPYVILKGYASAYYYPEPGLRAMGDVDFLVDNLEQASKDLIGHGYVSAQEKCNHHISYVKNGVRFELHWTPNGVFNDKIRQMFDDIVATAKVATTDFGDIPIPDDFHHGLIMLLHMLGHMRSGGGIGLRHLCDWTVFVHRLGNDFDCIFKDKLTKVRLYHSAQLFSLIAVKYLHLPYYPWMGEAAPEDLEKIMQNIISAGNFGRKDSGNREIFLAHNTLLEAANKVTKNYWSIARKCPLVLPFGWVYFGTIYFVKVLQGKRQGVFQAMKNKEVWQSLFEVLEEEERKER